MGYAFIEQETGPLRIFRAPDPGMAYTMGVDAATGLADDYSCIQIVTNTIPCYQAAVFRQQIPVSDFSKIVDMMGRYYNEALNVCEINYPGNSVQDSLLQFYKYPRNYQAESHLDEDVDIVSKYGFRTTEASKWLLIQEMQMALAGKGITINDPVTISELMNYVYQSTKRKAGAAAGFNDDTVMALMLAYHGAKLYPMIVPLKPEKKKNESVDPDTRKSWALFRNRIGQSRKKVLL